MTFGAKNKKSTENTSKVYPNSPPPALPAGEWFEGELQHQIEFERHPDEPPYWANCSEREYNEAKEHIDCRKVIVPVEQKEFYCRDYESGNNLCNSQCEPCKVAEERHPVPVAQKDDEVSRLEGELRNAFDIINEQAYKLAAKEMAEERGQRDEPKENISVEMMRTESGLKEWERLRDLFNEKTAIPKSERGLRSLHCFIEGHSAAKAEQQTDKPISQQFKEIWQPPKVKPQPAPPGEQKEVASDTDVLKRTRGLIKEVKRLPSYGEMWNLQSAVEQLESVLPG